MADCSFNNKNDEYVLNNKTSIHRIVNRQVYARANKTDTYDFIRVAAGFTTTTYITGDDGHAITGDDGEYITED